MPDDFNELDFINPYYSKMRQWLLQQLLAAFPSTTVSVGKGVYSQEVTNEVNSAGKLTAAKFTEWTGHTQQSLIKAWTSENEGFKPNDPNNPAHKGKGAFVRTDTSKSAVTTSCEGLINKVLQKIRGCGLVGNIQNTPDNLSSFNLGGYGKHGEEPPTVTGWHKASTMSKDNKPLPGDLFQAGVKFPFGDKWSFKHVGVILEFNYNGGECTWATLEAGQGGPAQGSDSIKRFALRPLNPMSKRDNRVLMGWLNIDEYFEPKLPAVPKVPDLKEKKG